MSEPETQPPAKTPFRFRLAWKPRWILFAAVAIVVLVAGAGMAVRYGANTVTGRALIESQANGLKLGRYGKLGIEGLTGDIWRQVSLRRLTISDSKGIWLDARDVVVDWRHVELLARRFHAEKITAREVRLLRRPILTAKTPPRPMPISVKIDAARLVVETLPEASYRRGHFDVVGSLDLVRQGPTHIRLGAASRLHDGDRVGVALDMGKGQPLVVVADAIEAEGGAIAGLLGLPADRLFSLKARAGGRLGAGQFSLLARSGATVPAQATGAWNKSGGSASGRISLAASSLTARFVPRFGDNVRFSGTGRQLKSGLYAIDGQADGETLSVTARGEADVGKRMTGAKGLAVTLATNTLDRLAVKSISGAARSEGVLTGNWSRWSYVGGLKASRFKYRGYGLAAVAGTVSVGRRNGELSVRSALAGAGGSGAGYIGALLGARPQAEFQGARLADGRLLMRRVTATGSGLKLDATGSRTLLGGLSFKGDALLTNLSAARIGSKGQAKAAWSASQGGRGKPWILTLDARGAGFATGYGELDRLLGVAPRIKGKAEISNGVIAVTTAELDGALASAKAAGLIGPEGALKLNLNWEANGPFRAGPVEFAGAAKGTGAITGSLEAARADLIADFATVDLPSLVLTDAHVTLSFLRGPGGADGQVAILADSEYGAARARTDFRFAEGGLDLFGLDADAGGVQAKGALSLRSGRASTADLTLAIGPGAVLTTGALTGTARIVAGRDGPRATIDLAARNAVLRSVNGLRFTAANFTADGPLERLPITLDGRGTYGESRWRFKGGGFFAQRNGKTGLALEGEGRFGAADFRTLEAARIGFGGGERSADLKLDIEGGRASITARADGDVADLRASLAGVSLGAINEDLAGVFDGELILTGRGSQLSGSLDASLRDARARGAGKAVSVNSEVKATLKDSLLSVAATASNASGLRSEMGLALPVEASAAPLRLAIVRQKPMSGRFSADGEVKPLWDLLVGGERSVSGNVSMAGTIGGTLADPRLAGRAELKNGAFEDGVIGLGLVDLSVVAVLSDNAIDVSQFTATDGRGGRVVGGGGGRLSGGGRISLLRDGVSSFRVKLEDFQLIENDAMTATASGDATLNRAADGKVQVSGALTVDRALVAANPPTPRGVVPMAVVERNRPEGGDADFLPEPSRGLVVALDVSLKATRGIFVEGRGLDAELSLDAHIGGTTAKPRLDGVARIVRGEYDFAGKRFEFDPRGAIYLATSPERIRLDLTATRNDPSLTAVIRVRGTAAKPEITLTSSPVLPNDEVLSRVLFGTSASQLSPIEAAQLASALAALAGGGGFDIIGNLKNFAGLDRLVFAGGGAAGAMTVAGGKYLTDDVYLEIIGGGREGPAAQVEWRVRRNLSLISRLQGQGGGRLSVRWRRDY
ncbi:MAG: translocation/assembly module TamB domain-containing protein [Caulobacter sp.]|nr:translocation/assembly module TamB domain-containing protein [Caulobacter sp.]